MTATPAVEITPLNQPWWDALAQGRLLHQTCGCGHSWLPPRMHCPACLGTQWRWHVSGGGATLVSWVVYHTSYHEYFKDRLPYNVAVVELDEGPRLVSSVIGHPDGRGLVIGQRLKLVIQTEGSTPVARFQIDSSA